MQQFFSSLAWPVRCLTTHATQALGLCTSKALEPEPASGVIQRTEKSSHWRHPEMVLSPDLEKLLCITSEEGGTASKGDAELLGRMTWAGVDSAVDLYRPCLRKRFEALSERQGQGEQPAYQEGRADLVIDTGLETTTAILKDLFKMLDGQVQKAYAHLMTDTVVRILAEDGLTPADVKRELPNIDEMERIYLIEQAGTGNLPWVGVPTLHTLIDWATQAAKKARTRQR